MPLKSKYLKVKANSVKLTSMFNIFIQVNYISELEFSLKTINFENKELSNDCCLLLHKYFLSKRSSLNLDGSVENPFDLMAFLMDLTLGHADLFEKIADETDVLQVITIVEECLQLKYGE